MPGTILVCFRQKELVRVFAMAGHSKELTAKADYYEDEWKGSQMVINDMGKTIIELELKVQELEAQVAAMLAMKLGMRMDSVSGYMLS